MSSDPCSTGGGGGSGSCGSPQWKGDNYCDDNNNNAGCGWDGGDCCGSNVNKQYCSICKCLDPNAQCSAKGKTHAFLKLDLF